MICGMDNVVKASNITFASIELSALCLWSDGSQGAPGCGFWHASFGTF